MEHVERMEMIRRGMMPPPYLSQPRTLVLSFLSLVLLAAAAVEGFSAIAYPAGGMPEGGRSWSLGSLLLLVGVVAALALAFGRARIARARCSTPARKLRALPPAERNQRRL